MPKVTQTIELDVQPEELGEALNDLESFDDMALALDRLAEIMPDGQAREWGQTIARRHKPALEMLRELMLGIEEV